MASSNVSSVLSQQDKMCKVCKKKVVNSEHCIKCKGAFHPSCAQQAKVFLESGDIVCCNTARVDSEVRVSRNAENVQKCSMDENKLMDMMKRAMKEYFEPIKNMWEEQIRELKLKVAELTGTVKEQSQLIEETKQTMKLVVEENNRMKDRIQECESKMDIECVVNEVMERQVRASNVVVFNVNEPNESNKKTRYEQEKNMLKEVLANVESLKEVEFKFQRLGKYGQGKVRPIKIMFPNKLEALTLLKEKNKIIKNIPSLRIYGDQTVKQREFFNELKMKIERYKQSGDDTKTIKYVNGVPKIVNKENF